MAVSVQMPKQGNTVEECLLVEWMVKEGDTVKEGDILCSIETDKASFEVESTAAGVVLRLLASAGDLVPVLTDIAVIGEAGEDAGAAAASAPAPAASAGSAAVPPPAEQPALAAAPAAAAPAAALPADGEFKAVSPRARKLAEKLGIDAAAVYGSGPGGRVTSRDIQSAADSGAAVRVSPAAREDMAETGKVPGPGTGIGGLVRMRDLGAAGSFSSRTPAPEEPPETVPYKGIRKLIGDRMLQSLMEHAQLTLNASAGAAGLMSLRKTFKENAEAAGLPKITINDMICWVVAQTLPSFPEVNAVFDRKGAVITRHKRVSLAVAVDTPRGLMVPVIADAHRLSLAGMSAAIAKLADDCRKGSVNPDLLSGGTFTISNLGSAGVESFTPVLNSPQVAILGVCAITNVPEPRPDGGLAFVPRLGLSLTIDHQIVDGAPGARFLQAVAKGIENLPAALALYGAM